MSLEFPGPGGGLEFTAGMLFGLRVWSFPVEPDEVKDTATLQDFHSANTGGPS